jgi:hypothetical protein
MEEMIVEKENPLKIPSPDPMGTGPSGRPLSPSGERGGVKGRHNEIHSGQAFLNRCGRKI